MSYEYKDSSPLTRTRSAPLGPLCTASAKPNSHSREVPLTGGLFFVAHRIRSKAAYTWQKKFYACQTSLLY